MLDSCFIQNSCNYYASPYVLIEKKGWLLEIVLIIRSLTSVELKPGFHFFW